jgi:hypothetical protein
MQDVLFIIDADDIALAEILAAKLQGQYRVYAFDPQLIDVLHASTLQNVELIVWESACDYPALSANAHAQAHAFEAELDAVARAMQPALSIRSWQHLNLYYFFLTYHWYSALWADILPRLRHVHPHIFLCDNPASFYWPAFLPSLLLLQYLRTFDIEFSAYPYGERADETDAIPYLCDSAGGAPADLLVHLPTCFYDAPYFNDELKASGRTATHLIAKYWDVEVAAAHRIKLIRTVPRHPAIADRLWDQAVRFADVMHDRLSALLAPFVATASFRNSQARHFANIYRSQFLTYFLLQSHFAAALPKKILLSDHDSGFHGPLIGFAEKYQIPVIVVPHAKTSEDSEFFYENMLSCTHPMQGIPVSDANGKLMAAQALRYPAQLSGSTAIPGPLKKIGLLLNGHSLNGILCTPWPVYLSGIKEIAGWCRNNGIALSIRCRPGQSLFHLLQQATGIGRADLLAALGCPLLTFAGGCDVCLMYDAPTNAGLDFLRNAIPLLNPVPAPLSKAEAATADAAIVARQSVAATLAMLDRFVAEPLYLQQFTLQQFAAYVALFRPARMLRELL